MARNALALVALLGLSACTGPSSQAPQPASPKPSGDGAAGTGSKTSSATGTGTAATGGEGEGAALDLVVVNALGQPADTARYEAGFGRLFKAVAKLQGARLSLVTGKKSGSLALDPKPDLGAGAKVVDFDLTPKEALVAALVAGCAEGESDFPDLHQTDSGNPKVCGTDLTTVAGNTRETLSHTWLWSLNPLRGVLKSNFRSGAKRVYVFVGLSDADLLDAQSFHTLAKAQAGGEPVVHVVVPDSDGCAEGAKKGNKYRAVAQANGGLVLDACASDWGPLFDQLAGALGQ